MAGCSDVASTTTVMVTKCVGRLTGESRKVSTFFSVVANVTESFTLCTHHLSLRTLSVHVGWDVWNW